jgi:hypothetical protein
MGSLVVNVQEGERDVLREELNHFVGRLHIRKIFDLSSVNTEGEVQDLVPELLN